MKLDPKELRDLRILMDTCERLFRALDARGLEFWLDWGTLLFWA